MPNTPTLNERAAKAMGWSWEYATRFEQLAWLQDGNYYKFGGDWSPSTDYNHAHLLYDRVVETGLEHELCHRLAWTDVGNAGEVELIIGNTLRLTAAQLTEACVEVIEEHERSKR